MNAKKKDNKSSTEITDKRLDVLKTWGTATVALLAIISSVIAYFDTGKNKEQIEIQSQQISALQNKFQLADSIANYFSLECIKKTSDDNSLFNYHIEGEFNLPSSILEQNDVWLFVNYEGNSFSMIGRANIGSDMKWFHSGIVLGSERMFSLIVTL
jgi:hypothetical protein